MGDVDKAAWEYLYKNAWVNDAGGEVVPYTVRHIVNQWKGTLNKNSPRIIRDLAAQSVRSDPGMIRMVADRIEQHYRDSGDVIKQGTFGDFSSQAAVFEERLKTSLRNADRLKRAGDELASAGNIGRAREAWSKADGQWKEAEATGKTWSGSSKDLRSNVSGEFKRLSRKGGPLYNTSEAQFSRFWEARNKHYATLQFLRTYKKDGFWGVVKLYGWKRLTSKFKDYYYTSHLNNLVQSLAGKLGVKGLLGKLADAQTFTKRLRAGFWLKKGLKKAGLWLIKKLGLGEVVGGILGSAIPLAGTAAGAVIGAVLQFAAEIVVEKLGGVMKIVGYTLAGVVGFFAFFAIGTIMLISIILSNEPYPWEATAGEVDCNQAATATDACVLPKSVVKGVADRWGVGPGNHVEECYSDVIAKAQSAGVRPDFAMAIWLNESNASNYGVSPADFGIRALDNQGFTAQITRFLSLPSSYKANYPQCFAAAGNPMLAFMTIFLEGATNCTDPSVIARGQAYLDKIRTKAFSFVSSCSWPSYPK
ncbi:MAG: hypothetical protein WD940_00325 [Patescibacteria group bacterium]